MSSSDSPSYESTQPELPHWLTDAMDQTLKHDDLHLVLLQRTLGDILKLRLKLANETRLFQSSARVTQNATDTLRQSVEDLEEISTPLTEQQHAKLCALVSGDLTELNGAK
jgi:hypothetical protein